MASHEVLLPLAVMTVILAIIVGGIAHDRRRLGALAEDLAARGFATGGSLGLFAHGLDGTFSGRRASLRHIKDGENGPWTTRAVVACSSPPEFRLLIDREGLLASLAKKLGAEDKEVGDAAFDAAMRVRAEDMDRATFVLDEEARDALRALDLHRFEVDQRTVTVQAKGRLWDGDAVANLFRVALRAADRVEATREG